MGEHLERLAEHRVFSIERLPDGLFKIWEECDSYFNEVFTPQALRELAAEIVELSHKTPANKG